MVLGATGAHGVDAVLDALPDPVALLDEQLVVVRANTALRRLVGTDPGGSPLTAVLAAEQAAVLRRAAQAAVAAGAWDGSTVVALADGHRHAVRMHVGAVESAGAGTGLLVTLAPRASAVWPEDLAAELARAVRTDELVLHYQPVVRLGDRRPVMVEALVRWEHPRRGLLWPSDFLAAADGTGTSDTAELLGRRVLREACHAAATWAKELRSGKRMQVAVNLSERQLLAPGTVSFVREALQVADCTPGQLLLEVPEAALLREPDSAARSLQALRALGVQIAVDDLGTGSSPLSYLKRFPIDLVKIDRSLVAGVGNGSDAGAVVASLVALARAIDVRCVAEGVETADQLEVLRLLGCDLGQGYLFTRPMPRHAVDEWLLRLDAPRPRPSARDAAAVDPQTAARALALQEEGASLHTIAARLNAEGHRNAIGRRWHHSSVAQLIAAHRFPGIPLT